ncbi:hypothetical protein NA56DRAFT_699605 [Hyaloscypha hepaticicola]|uniref:Uncharacterized protein n=1 Tax=Hyaloscypha hepaticicola TaxID=2082293 RepID=A0A2J6QF04_9HELO|nr:hypothetical protein NA56DRAFT_699605 [Hyaloscypha hepaticicola]
MALMDGKVLSIFVNSTIRPFLCTSFIPFVSRWRELDLGHSTSAERCWTPCRIIGLLEGYMEKLVGELQSNPMRVQQFERGSPSMVDVELRNIQSTTFPTAHCASMLRRLCFCPTNMRTRKGCIYQKVYIASRHHLRPAKNIGFLAKPPADHTLFLCQREAENKLLSDDTFNALFSSPIVKVEPAAAPVNLIRRVDI